MYAAWCSPGEQDNGMKYITGDIYGLLAEWVISSNNSSSNSGCSYCNNSNNNNNSTYDSHNALADEAGRGRVDNKRI